MKCRPRAAFLPWWARVNDLGTLHACQRRFCQGRLAVSLPLYRVVSWRVFEELQQPFQAGQGRVMEPLEKGHVGVVKPGLMFGPVGGRSVQLADGVVDLAQAGGCDGAVERPGERVSRLPVRLKARSR